MPHTDNELRYFDALKRITCYQSVEQLRKDSEDDWGLQFEEALAYAYENVIEEARRAIAHRRRPIPRATRITDSIPKSEGAATPGPHEATEH